MSAESRLIIDDTGAIYAARSPELYARLGVSLANPSRASFAIRTLGFIGLSSRARNVRIWLTPQAAAARAVATVRDHLRHSQPARTVLTMVGAAGESDRVIAGWENAITSVNMVITEARFRRRDAHLSEPRDETALAKFPALQFLHHQWTASHGTFETLELARPVLNGARNLRCVVAECDLATGTSLIREMQGPFTAFETRWLKMAAGLRVQDQVDYGYGLWVSDTYATVAASGMPWIDDVDIEVIQGRNGLIRSRYRRLLLPISSNRRDIVQIISANIIDRSIDLRSKKAS